MSDLATETKPMSLLQRGVFQNPITLKELRSRMRGRRAFVILSLYLLATCTIIFFIYLFLVFENSTSTTGTLAGQTVFFFMIAIQMFLVVFVAPAFTSGSITGEKERQTFELLRTTLMSPRRFVFGKTISALGYVMLLIVSTIPLISLAFMIGGITWIEVVISQLMLIAGAFTYSLMGLYFSSRMKSTLSATVTTYIVSLAILVGFPLVVLLGSLIISPILFATGGPPDWMIPIFANGAMALSFTNLPTAMVVAEVLFQEENAIFWYRDSGTPSFFIISPWYGTLLFHFYIAWVFFRWTVRRVSKIAE